MPQDIRIWEIDANDTLIELSIASLNLEERLENWLDNDISIISDELLVIGRQVPTDFGGSIDLLCLDNRGDLVVVELKRDKTPRDIVAQVLDYASWVKNLSHDEIREIAGTRLGKNDSLEDIFQKKFGAELPEVLNQDHGMYIVASKLDSSTERIVNYLSDYRRINAVSFSYFKQDGKEYLARVFLVEPGLADVRSRSPKRRPYLTQEELEEIADSNGVGELYLKLVERLADSFDEKRPTTSSLAFQGIQEGKRNTIFSLIPVESDANRGLKFQLYINRFCKYFNMDRQTLDSMLPADKMEKPFWRSATPDQSGYEGFFKADGDVERFLSGLRSKQV